MLHSGKSKEMFDILYQVSDLYIKAMGWNTDWNPGGESFEYKL